MKQNASIKIVINAARAVEEIHPGEFEGDDTALGGFGVIAFQEGGVIIDMLILVHFTADHLILQFESQIFKLLSRILKYSLLAI